MTKHHFPPSNPDEQAFLDFGDDIVSGATPEPQTDLESTFLHIQGTLRQTSAEADAMPADLRHQTWTRVLESSAYRHHRPMRLGLSTPPRRPVVSWINLATLALAAAFILASVNMWSTYDGFDLFGEDVERGPVPTHDLAVAPTTPEATAAVSRACDFQSSIPIFIADEPPIDGPALYLSDNGDLRLRCSTTETGTLLEDDVRSVETYPYPNFVKLSVGSGPNPPPTLLNIATGEHVTLDLTGFTRYLGHPDWSQRFKVVPDQTDPGSWAIYDLETMRHVSLMDIGGVAFPTSDQMSVSMPATGTTMAFASGGYDSESSAFVERLPGADGDILVVQEDLATSHWISLPADFPPVTNFTISPDGSLLTILSRPIMGNTATIGLIDTATGAELTRTASYEAVPGDFTMQWIEGEQEIVYAVGGTLYRLQGTANASPEVLYEAEHKVSLVAQMAIPHVVHLAEDTEDEGLQSLIIFDTSTDEATRVEGKFRHSGFASPLPMVTPLAPLKTQLIAADGTRTWELNHPVTGQPLISAEGLPNATPEADIGYFMYYPPVTTASEAPVSIVLTDTNELLIVNLELAPAVTRTIALPDGVGRNNFRAAQLSPDGRSFTISAYEDDIDVWYLLDLTDAQSAWVEVSGPYPVGFTIHDSNQPDHAPDSDEKIGG